MLKQFASIVLLLASGTQVLAFEALKIEGTAFLDEEACTKSGNCNLTFKIGGEMAKVIYDGMGTAARTNEETGGFDKTDRSGMSCHKDDAHYSCSFRYDFRLRAFSLSLIEG
jgi:hypothetical protein